MEKKNDNGDEPMSAIGLEYLILSTTEMHAGGAVRRQRTTENADNNASLGVRPAGIVW